MVKRFSVKAFILATVVHLAGTVALIEAGFRALLEFKRTGVEPHWVWVSVWAWIWQPISTFVSYYIRHHPRPPVEATNLDDFFRSALAPHHFIFYFMLPWSLFVGIFFGFLVPGILRWRHQAHLTKR
jgi:hypothetical protein